MATDPVTIDVKVKTLNSQTHDFSVQNDITVRQFKEHIADTVGIQPELQRIIYRGRILNDTVQLKEYDMHGKVVHLVERPPPAPGQEAASDNPQPNTTTAPNRRRVFLHRGANGQPNAAGGATGTGSNMNLSSTLCPNRITVARHMLQCATNLINHMDNPQLPLDNAPMDLLIQDTTVLEVGISAMSDVDQVQDIMHAFRGAVNAAFRPDATDERAASAEGAASEGGNADLNSSTGSSSSSASSLSLDFDVNDIQIRSMVTDPTAPADPAQPPAAEAGQSATTTDGAENQSADGTTTANNGNGSTNGNGRTQQTTSPRVLGEVVEEMRIVQRRLEPHLQRYYSILMNEPTYTAEETARREEDQREFDRVSEVLHYMAHAQHAISDLMLDLSTDTPRHLCCRRILIDHSAFVNTAMPPPPAEILLAMGGMGGPVAGGRAFQFSVPLNGDPAAQAAAPPGNAPTAPPPTSGTPQGTPRRVVNPAAGQGGAQGAGRNIPAHHHHVATIPILLPQTAHGNPTMEQLQQSVAAAAAATIQSVGFNEILQSVLSVVPMATIELQHGNDPPITINVPPQPQHPPQQQPTSSAEPQTADQQQQSQTGTSSATNTSNNNTGGRGPFANTMPTTSTQTRSTARPQVHVTSIQQPTEIRGARSFSTSQFSSFDRYLPCNSHHVRDDQLRGGQAPGAAAAGVAVGGGVGGAANGMAGRVQGNVIRIPHGRIEIPIGFPIPFPMRPARPGSVSNSRSASRERPAGATATSNNQSAAGASRSVTPSDDLDAVYNSQDPDEEFVMGVRDALHAFIVARFFNNSAITVDNIKDGVSEIVIGLEDLLAPISNYEHPNICIRLSVLGLLRTHLQEIINLLRRDDEEGDENAQAAERRFGSNMIRSIRLLAVRLSGILLQSNQRRQDIRQLFRTIFNRYLKELDSEPVKVLLKFALKVCLQTIDNKFGSTDTSVLTPYLVYKSPSADEASPMEVEDSDGAVGGAVASSQTQDVQMEAQPSTSGTATGTTISHRSLLTRLRCESECEDYPEVPETAPWHASVPNGWINTLANDVDEQRKINDSRAQPLSDAYLESMSKKRRKIITDTRPTGSVTENISAGVRHVIQNSGFQTTTPAEQIASQISSDVGLQSSYRESMNTSIKDRLRTDPNYDPKKYPNTEKYFK